MDPESEMAELASKVGSITDYADPDVGVREEAEEVQNAILDLSEKL